METVMHVLRWLEEHELVFWILMSTVILPWFSRRTPEQWIELGERSPRLHGLLSILRGAGFDPVKILRGAQTVVTGKVATKLGRQNEPTSTPSSATPPPLPKSSTPPPSSLVLLLVVLGAVSPNVGCGGWANTGRYVIQAAAVGVDDFDVAMSDRFREECSESIEIAEATGDSSGVDACVHANGFDRATLAIAEADRMLRVAQAVLDDAEREGDEGRWTAALPCLARAAKPIYDMARQRGVQLRAERLQALAELAQHTGECAADAVAPPAARDGGAQ